jgi:hypothetical protein
MSNSYVPVKLVVVVIIVSNPGIHPDKAEQPGSAFWID